MNTKVKIITITAVLIALILLIAGFVFLNKITNTFEVNGTSMEPTFSQGDLISVSNKKNVKHGDAIVYQKRGSIRQIHRVIGIEGDTLVITEDGIVLINGKAESYQDFNNIPLTYTGSMVTVNEEFIVPTESFFVLGDNRNASRDSRSIGFITSEEVIGIVD